MTRWTQQELEERMYQGGIDRQNLRMQDAEAAGEAARNPYAATVYQDFVLPLSELVASDVQARKVGARAAHIALLQPLDGDNVAVLAVRQVMSYLLAGEDPKVRRVGYAVGSAIHSELVLAEMEHLAPDLYHTLTQDFGRKHSRSVKHRMTVFKMQAGKAGITVSEWGVGAREQVGLYLLDCLARLGMIEIDAPPAVAGKRLPIGTQNMLVRLAPPVLEIMQEIRELVAVTMPLYGPCVEPPRDWVSAWEGGFHTPAMQRAHRCLIKAPSAARERFSGAVMPKVLSAVNALQKTAWRVNQRVLDTVQQVAQFADFGEIVLVREHTKPPAPTWLRDTQSKGDMSPEEAEEFHTWKRTMAEWYTQRKLAGVKYGRFHGATRAAETFRDQPEVYFVYFADSRGRVYPLTYGVNPQGSDLQKALLEFAHGKPLHTESAQRWFLIHGANKWGFDKATLDERAEWHRERHLQIMAIASDPVSNLEWRSADKPLQFLAWCLEYAEWQIDPQGFESRIAVSMDGSCNGLQNFSAMLRDEVGGKATNLTDNAVMEDIYRRVAEEATRLMQAAPPDEGNFQARWLAHSIERSAVKRAVMTTPYGVTKRSAVNYVMEDYLRQVANPFERKEYLKAAQYLMDFVWPAIGKVVVKAREAMTWLHTCARAIVKERGETEEGVISWVTPSGFPATQAYYEAEEHRINTRLHGTVKLKVLTETDEASSTQHSSGLAPNFVHSMDASHLHLTAAACASRGIDALAMIHDDYGTHAADSQELYEIIREQFVLMYEENDPIQEFSEQYPECPPPPVRGNLVLREVMQSQYFFS